MQLGAREASTTIVMAPRESYTAVPTRIAGLRDTPGPGVRLVVVDEARCPPWIRKRVSALATEHGFTHVCLDHRAGANECRMAGFEHVTTPFVLFLDNDARLREGAVERLVARAEATDASFVAPLCVNGNGTIHFAGSVARLAARDGHRDIVEMRPHGHPSADEVAPLLEAAPTDAPELHGVLIRADALREAGGLDRHLDSSMDCVDTGLRLQHVAGGGWLEPGAAVVYENARPRLADLPLYLDRWSRASIRHDIDHFAEVWHIDPGSPGLNAHWVWLGHRRFRPFRWVRGGLRRTLGDRAAASFERISDRVLERTPVITRRR